MLIVPHIVIQPPSLVISGSECIVLVHRRSPRSTESGHEGTELPILYKDCDSKYVFLFVVFCRCETAEEDSCKWKWIFQ